METRRTLLQKSASLATVHIAGGLASVAASATPALSAASDYIARLDAAPSDQKWPMARDWIRTQPAPFFAELRRSRPILVLPEVTLLTLRSDCVDVLSLPRLFTVQLYGRKMGSFMLGLDETPINFRDKGVMQAMLPRSDLPRIKALVEATAKKILDESKGRIELVQQYARLVPLRLVNGYFGFTGPDADMLEWSLAAQWDQFNNHPFDGWPNSAKIASRAALGLIAMLAHVTELTAKREAELAQTPNAVPQDMLGRLLRNKALDQVGFDRERLVLNVGGALIGAIETTAEAVVNALAELLARPEEFEGARRAAQDGKPGILENYVWEAMRFAPIAPFMFRVSSAEHVLARGTFRETRIPQGATVLAAIQSAMADPAWVEAPDTFRIDRPDHIYMHFGYGHHDCLGRYIAMTMIPEMLRQVLLRSNLRATGPVDRGGGPFPVRYELTYG